MNMRQHKMAGLPCFALGLAMAIGLFGCGESSSLLNQQALEKLSQNDLPGAETLLMKAIQLDPVNEVLFSNLVEIFFREQKWDQAVNLLKQTQSMDALSQNVAMKTRLCEAYVMTGDNREAFKLADELLKKNPENDYLLFLHGLTDPSPENSAKSLKKSIELNPKRSEAYLALSRAIALTGETAAAREVLKQSAEKNGPSSDLFLADLSLFVRDNDWEMARKLIAEASQDLRSRPLTQLFQAYLDLGDRKVAEARSAFESLEESAEVANKAKLGAALCSLMEDDPNLAIEACEEVLQANPKEVSAHVLMGLGQLKRLQKFLAKKSFENALQINPDQPSIRALVEKISAQ